MSPTPADDPLNARSRHRRSVGRDVCVASRLGIKIAAAAIGGPRPSRSNHQRHETKRRRQ